jgi:hypothetical protein
MASTAPPKRRFRWLFWLVVVPLALLVLYTWFMLTWSYSRGDRAGYVQKLSERGWICKTWEGELALVSMPGTVTEKFLFSVRSDAVAKQINDSIGKRVSLDYEQHVGLPTSCFGDTDYFVTGLRIVGDIGQGPNAPAPPPAPAAVPPAPEAAPAPAAPADSTAPAPK